ncbi:hypothetical protein D3C76_1690960 [compost metagenome]
MIGPTALPSMGTTTSALAPCANNDSISDICLLTLLSALVTSSGTMPSCLRASSINLISVV